MARLRDLLRAVDRALDRALLDGEDPTALGVLRAAIAAVLTASLLCHVGAIAEYFSRAAPLHGEFAREAFPSRLSPLFVVDDPTWVRTFVAIGVVAHVCWTVGWFTTVAGLLSFFTWVGLVGRNPLLYSLPDQLQMGMAMVLAAMPAGRGFSLDARLRGRGRPVPVWCRRLVQLQLAVLYTGTGLLKSGTTWKDGTALYYALMNPYNRHFDVAPLLAGIQPWLLRPMTWLVLAWEVGFAGFVGWCWLRLGRPRLADLRPVYLGFGVAMHLGIQAMLYVVWFSPLCLASYLAFFDGAELRSAVARIRSWAPARNGPRPA